MAGAPSAIVVGASISGLAAAIALLRRGFAVTVVEHAERGAPGGAGLALTHAALLQLHARIGSVRQGCHGPIPSAEALTEMSGDASTAHRSRI